MAPERFPVPSILPPLAGPCHSPRDSDASGMLGWEHPPGETLSPVSPEPGQAGWVLSPATGRGRGWERGATGWQSILGAKMPGTGMMWEPGQSWGAPRAAVETGHKLVTATAASLAAPLGVQLHPSPRAGGTRPPGCPVCPCHPVARLHQTGSRSLLLVAFQAAPLGSPLVCPIYSSGLFLGQA